MYNFELWLQYTLNVRTLNKPINIFYIHIDIILDIYMDGILLSCQYAFTITLKPRLYTLDPTKQYDKVIDTVVLNLRCMGQVTAVCELTKASNIHFHGIIQFYMKGLTKTVRYEWNRVWRQYKDLIGFTNLKQLDNYETWTDYLSKELEQTKKDLIRPPIILDEHKVFKDLALDFVQQGMFRIPDVPTTP